MTATHHRFNFLQPTTTHRIFLNCRPRVPHMFKWNSPEPGLKGTQFISLITAHVGHRAQDKS